MHRLTISDGSGRTLYEVPVLVTAGIGACQKHAWRCPDGTRMSLIRARCRKSVARRAPSLVRLLSAERQAIAETPPVPRVRREWSPVQAALVGRPARRPMLTLRRRIQP
jgi:hypothetical protein